MARIQLALNVDDLDEAVAFYTTFFDTPPHKQRPGYANFAIDDPPLKLVLFEDPTAEQLNHLGVEVTDTDDVSSAVSRLRDAGLDPDVREQELCCHAVQDKLWVTEHDTRWEVYTITDDAPVADRSEAGSEAAPTVAACC